MAKGLGIAGLVVALIALFAPLPLNVILLLLMALILVVAALGGERVFTVASVVISTVNVLVLSPVTLGAAFAGRSDARDSSRHIAPGPNHINRTQCIWKGSTALGRWQKADIITRDFS